MSGRKSRNKGANEERAIVNLHRDMGVRAQRTLEAGARSDGSVTYDLDVYAFGEEEAPLIGECKIRADGFKQIYDWLGENDFLTIRADRKERLYVVPEELWKTILKRL
jgi:hypothetical protein